MKCRRVSQLLKAIAAGGGHSRREGVRTRSWAGPPRVISSTVFGVRVARRARPGLGPHTRSVAGKFDHRFDHGKCWRAGRVRHDPELLRPNAVARTCPALLCQPNTLHPQLSTLNPQPSTLHPQPCTLNPTPSTLNPTPSTLNPTQSTLNPQPSTLHPQPSALKPQTSTLNPQPSNLNPQPSTLNPQH